MKKIFLVSLLVVLLVLTTLTALVLAAPGGVNDPNTLQALAAARAATAKYHDVSVAGADGYAPATEPNKCIEDPGLGAMGFHYVNFGLLDVSFNSATPEILLYVPAGNRLRLAAVEYAVVGLDPGDLPGDDDDDAWEFHAASCHYTDESEEPCDSPADADAGKTLALWHPDISTLHVWLWQANPNGLFEGFNPKARC